MRKWRLSEQCLGRGHTTGKGGSKGTGSRSWQTQSGSLRAAGAGQGVSWLSPSRSPAMSPPLGVHLLCDLEQAPPSSRPQSPSLEKGVTKPTWEGWRAAQRRVGMGEGGAGGLSHLSCPHYLPVTPEVTSPGSVTHSVVHHSGPSSGPGSGPVTNGKAWGASGSEDRSLLGAVGSGEGHVGERSYVHACSAFPPDLGPALHF